MSSNQSNNRPSKKDSASLRKMKKPLIEKRRRDRINKSLTQLRNLLLDNMKRTGVTQTSKLDKADILELTVSYVKLIQFEEAEVAMATKRQYKSGYLSCARAALKCMDQTLKVNKTVKSNLENFLTERCNSSCYAGYDNNNQLSCSVRPTREPITIQIPTTSSPNSNRQCFHNQSPLEKPTKQTNVRAFANYSEREILNDISLNESPTHFEKTNSSLEVLDVSETSSSHELNLSSADSSFSGDVWRPW